MMMKRLALLFAVAGLAVLLVPALAFANMGSHGGYTMDTDQCAGCHRTHTAASTITWQDTTLQNRSALLVSTAVTMDEFCYACHDATSQGADTNVQTGIYEGTLYGETGAILNGGGFDSLDASATTSTHMYTGATWGAYGGGYTGQGTTGADGQYTDPTDPPDANVGESVQIKMDCATCHDPHGSSNYRALIPRVNGNYVGGYVPSADPENPTPDPWVWSTELNYPAGGFKLHTEYPDYVPNYTTPLYARGYDANAATGPENATKGMSGWCVGCHSTYMTPTEVLTKADGTQYTAMAWNYNAGDGSGLALRHKHPMNVPMSNYDGPSAESLIVTAQVLPLAHQFEADGTVVQETVDWVECLTCHRAHGTAAVMEGFAADGALVVNSDGFPTNEFPSATPSALLRLDNRGVCQQCHNK